MVLGARPRRRTFRNRKPIELFAGQRFDGAVGAQNDAPAAIDACALVEQPLRFVGRDKFIAVPDHVRQATCPSRLCIVAHQTMGRKGIFLTH
jgi:hypothetical protein